MLMRKKFKGFSYDERPTVINASEELITPYIVFTEETDKGPVTRRVQDNSHLENLKVRDFSIETLAAANNMPNKLVSPHRFNQLTETDKIAAQAEYLGQKQDELDLFNSVQQTEPEPKQDPETKQDPEPKN